jgi:WD40 repeat protein
VLPSDEDNGAELNVAGINANQPNLSPGGEWLALASGKQYHVVDCTTGQTAKSFDSNPGINRSLILSPAGELLLACAFDFSAAKKHHSTMWNFRDGSIVARLESTNVSFGPAGFTPDGQRFAVATFSKDQGHRLEIYDRRGKLVSTVPNIPEQVTALAFTHDGRGMITGLTDASILVWGPAAFVPAKAEETQP